MKQINIPVPNPIYALNYIVNLYLKRINVLMIVKMMININMNITIVVLKNVKKIQKYMKKEKYA